MSAMTNILVKDDTITTPVQFGFAPISDTPTPFWRTNISGVPLNGQPRLSMGVTPLKAGAVKISVKLEVPVMETLGASGSSAGYVAPPKVAYVNTAIFTMFADGRSTPEDRANLLKMALGVLQGASSTADTGILANTAAGNAFVNSVLPAPLMFSSGAVPF